jgi:hypothetical protein
MSAMHVIVSCRIGPMPKTIFDKPPKVEATFDDGEVKTLFTFFPDEISFTEQELIGLTEQQAGELFVKKDTAYLRA